MKKFFLALSALTVALSAASLYYGWRFMRQEFPDVSVLRHEYPVVVYRGKSEPSVVRLQKARPEGWVSLSQVSHVAIGAVIVSEDWAFYQHKGYDVNQIREAVREDWEEGRFARGASTITQQVARNVFLDKDKNLWRKLKELYLAVRLEEVVGKRRILETYLNVAEWGDGIYGIREAAKTYFGKEPAELTAKEGAFLAMLLPSRSRYSASFRAKQLTDFARESIDSILSKMTQAHYLTEEEREAQLLVPLSFEKPSPSSL